MVNARRYYFSYTALLLVVVTILAFVAPTFTNAAPIQTAPIVSIGVDNGNMPLNSGPVHGGEYQGLVPVYATVTDNHLQTYHFRVIKDGAAQGHTCNDLFASENQGYASSTLGRDACGFAFNQSVYTFTSPAGFTNKLIATLDTQQLAVYGGYGG